MSRARLLVTVTYPTGHRRDVANLQATVKPLVNSMVHPFPGVRGLLPDDDDDHLIGPDMRHILPNTPGRYVVTLDFEEGQRLRSAAVPDLPRAPEVPSMHPHQPSQVRTEPK